MFLASVLILLLISFATENTIAGRQQQDNNRGPDNGNGRANSQGQQRGGGPSEKGGPNNAQGGHRGQ